MHVYHGITDWIHTKPIICTQRDTIRNITNTKFECRRVHLHAYMLTSTAATYMLTSTDTHTVEAKASDPSRLTNMFS